MTVNIKEGLDRPVAAAAGSSRLARLAAALAGLRGWRRHGAAALCGALAAAALPPLHLVPLLIPAFTGLLWLMDGTVRRRDAALLGWSFGFGHMLAGLYWIGIAFLVDAARFGLVMPFAMFGLIAGLALFPSIAVFAAAWLGWRGPARAVLLAAAWLAMEWLRAWVLTGFPWNLIGNVWTFSPAMLQLAALTGVWGLSLMTVLAAAAPAVLVETNGARARGRRLFVAAMLLLPALVWGGGTLRLAAAPPLGADAVEGVVLRLVQPSIEQALKWKVELRRDHVARQMRLSAAPGAEHVNLVIWAETAVPYLLTRDAELRSLIARVVPEGGLLLAGAPRAGTEGGRPRLWNSLYALDGAGGIVATYDKFRLVPFGEYMPLRSILGFAKLSAGSVDFSPGRRPVALSLPGLPVFAPLICYESIFPGRVVAAGSRPEWLLNITNDAWFGTSSGPFQHFASARMRAVEEGLPLVRVANNGISGVVDAYGRIVARLGLNEIGILDSRLPRPTDEATVFARYGDWMALLLALGAGFLALMLRRIVA